MSLKVLPAWTETGCSQECHSEWDTQRTAAIGQPIYLRHRDLGRAQISEWKKEHEIVNNDGAWWHKMRGKLHTSGGWSGSGLTLVICWSREMFRSIFSMTIPECEKTGLWFNITRKKQQPVFCPSVDLTCNADSWCSCVWSSEPNDANFNRCVVHLGSLATLTETEGREAKLFLTTNRHASTCLQAPKLDRVAFSQARNEWREK